MLVYFAGMRFLPKLHEKGTGWKLVLAGGIAGGLAGLLMAIASGSFSAAGALMLVMFLGGILFGFLYWIVNLQILKVPGVFRYFLERVVFYVAGSSLFRDCPPAASCGRVLKKRLMTLLSGDTIYKRQSAATVPLAASGL